ncbi:tripartite tricarboxylate transporter TctB family protein [Natrinema sp. 1APR25-10V2]|uniref:tripartite tricarboxylate transporter TctB family protein n=1 Tax=Natrinema sp. 1APR25-10V2 TaxID=2951081 RepID=UPI002875A688|nr:tripartite tricarboxylate transporter TctB family protein [Natrinema sp. 1APR25-10V2]MDS0476935.1 tripartite tricarboxylate transporter TctB family protein [Natrinema sp. 1APR25-10V2]
MSEGPGQTESETRDLPTDPTDNTVPDIGYDALITVFTILFSLVFIVLSRDFAGIRISEYDPGAAFWPRAALSVVILASVVNLWKIYKEAKVEGQISELIAVPSFSGEVDVKEGDKRFVATIITFGTYLWIIEPLGFLVSTPFFLVVVAWMLGYRGRPVRIVAFGILTTVVFFAVFTNLNIALPRGTGPFQQFSIFVENFLSI